MRSGREGGWDRGIGGREESLDMEQWLRFNGVGRFLMCSYMPLLIPFPIFPSLFRVLP